MLSNMKKAFEAAPKAIVVSVDGAHYVAEPESVAKSNFTDDDGPSVVLYRTIGRAYRSEVEAAADAELVLLR